MRARSMVALAALATTALAAPAAAFHNPPLPVLATDTLAGPGWTAYRVAIPADGTRVDIEMEAQALQAGTVTMGTWVIDAQHRLEGAFLFTAISGEERIHVEGPLGLIYHVDRGGSGAGGGLALSTTLPAGEHILIAMAAHHGGTIRRSTATLYAPEGVSLEARTRGQDTFLYREPDFTAPLNVSAATRGVSAKAVVQGVKQTTVDGRLFGIYMDAALFTDVAVMGYDGPQGSQDGSSFYFFTDAPPGDYRFRLDANAGGGLLAAVVVAGAAVTLP